MHLSAKWQLFLLIETVNNINTAYMPGLQNLIARKCGHNYIDCISDLHPSIANKRVPLEWEFLSDCAFSLSLPTCTFRLAIQDCSNFIFNLK